MKNHDIRAIGQQTVAVARLLGSLLGRLAKGLSGRLFPDTPQGGGFVSIVRKTCVSGLEGRTVAVQLRIVLGHFQLRIMTTGCFCGRAVTDGTRPGDVVKAHWHRSVPVK